MMICGIQLLTLKIWRDFKAQFYPLDITERQRIKGVLRYRVLQINIFLLTYLHNKAHEQHYLHTCMALCA